MNENEAKHVRLIYECYLEVGSVAALANDLFAHNVCSKVWVSNSGNRRGGKPFSRGALYRILKNQLYLGKITHENESYEGLHDSIVPQALWRKANERLAENRRAKQDLNRNITSSLLQGYLFDDEGHPMVPHYAAKPNGKRYRYYVSAAKLRIRKGKTGSVYRVPAECIERLVADYLSPIVKENGVDLHCASTEKKRNKFVRVLQRVEIRSDGILLFLKKVVTLSMAELRAEYSQEILVEEKEEQCTVRIPFVMKRSGHSTNLHAPSVNKAVAKNVPDATLVKNLADPKLSLSWNEQCRSLGLFQA